MLVHELRKIIREIPDFPKPGINFYDVSTLFRNAEAFRYTLEKMVERYRGERIDAVAGIEARGLVLAAVMARDLGTGLILVRKPGKLPWHTESEEYSLEYGTSRIEIHRDAVKAGQRILVVDDLLATGGTAAATGRLVQRLGGTIEGYAFMVELTFMGGRKHLDPAPVFSLIHVGGSPAPIV
jgi:adenine phosphoribosyltransferase